MAERGSRRAVSVPVSKPGAWRSPCERKRRRGGEPTRDAGQEVTTVKFYLGDVVQMRKPHPCGDDRWEVLRTGMDFRIRCLGCGRMVMVPRRKFEKSVEAVLRRPIADEGGAAPREDGTGWRE